MKKPMKKGRFFGHTPHEDNRPLENEEDIPLFCDPQNEEEDCGYFSKIKEKQRLREKNKENDGFFG